MYRNEVGGVRKRIKIHIFFKNKQFLAITVLFLLTQTVFLKSYNIKTKWSIFFEKNHGNV